MACTVDVFVVRAGTQFEVQATNTVGEIVATPAISDGMLLARTLKHLHARRPAAELTAARRRRFQLRRPSRRSSARRASAATSDTGFSSSDCRSRSAAVARSPSFAAMAPA